MEYNKYSKKKYINAIKEIFKTAKKSCSHYPELQTVARNKDNYQFVCDGQILVLWHDYHEELEVLPQTSKELTHWNPDGILQSPYSMICNSVSENERSLLEKLTKYIKLYPPASAHGYVPIYIFGRYFDAKLLKTWFTLVDTYIDNRYTTNNKITSSVYFFNPETSSIIFPLNIDEEEKQEVQLRTQQFIENLTKW